MPFTTDILLVILGVIPSLFWLFYFLKRDPHPEPRSMIARTFLMAIILSPLAVILQLASLKFAAQFQISFFTSESTSFLLWAAFVEEVVKLLAVRAIVLRNPNFDEPVDAIIYMMVAGLGFAAIENILVLFRTIPDGVQATATIWLLRSVGATLLHALSSGLLGYFLALSWFFEQHRTKIIFAGLLLATFFHFVFNVILSTIQNGLVGIAYTTGLLLVLAFLVSILFVKIRERRIQRSGTAPATGQTDPIVA